MCLVSKTGEKVHDDYSTRLTPCSQSDNAFQYYQRKSEESPSVVVNVAVTGQDLALELLGVLVPELSSLGVEGRIAARHC